MSSDAVIQVENIGKCFRLYQRHHHRLLQLIPGRREPLYREFRYCDCRVGKLQLALGEPYVIVVYQVRLTTSMGDVVYPADGQTHEELTRRADAALYRAKGRRRDAVIEALPAETLAEADTKDPGAFRQPGHWQVGAPGDAVPVLGGG